MGAIEHRCLVRDRSGYKKPRLVGFEIVSLRFYKNNSAIKYITKSLCHHAAVVQLDCASTLRVFDHFFSVRVR